MNKNPRNTVPFLILTGYALSLLAVLGLGWYFTKTTLQLRKITQELYTHPFAVSNAATQMDSDLNHLRNHTVQVAFVRDENTNHEQLRNESEALAKTAKAGLGVIISYFLGDMNRVKELEDKLRQWDDIRLQVHDAAEKGDYATAEHLVRAVETPIFADIMSHVHYVLSFSLDQAKAYVEESGKRSELVADRIGWLIAILAAFIVVTSLVVVSRVRHLQKEHEKNLRRLINTESALREGEARARMAKAERASQAKSEFLSRMSHELRTPLHAIIAFSDLILYEKDLDPKLEKHIQHINKAGDHLLELVDDVLDLAKIESGSLNIAVRPVKLREVLEECYSLIKPTADDAEIELSFDTQVDYIVDASHTSLKQALLNLLSNAVKYNKQSGIVTVSYEVRDNKRLRINIIDTGHGLSTEQQKLLFMPFERMGAELTQVKGTGIGLTITKQLATMMGGTVGVESSIGKGSKFWIELPLSDQQTITQPEPAPIKRSISRTEQSKYIVYVEDDPINAHLMEAIINRMTNHKLAIAKTGDEGLKLIFERLPDLVLLDLGLPDTDGYKILEQMRAHPQARKIPAIAMTAKAMMDDIERGEKAGFDDYIVKPARAAELLKSIELVKRRY